MKIKLQSIWETSLCLSVFGRRRHLSVHVRLMCADAFIVCLLFWSFQWPNGNLAGHTKSNESSYEAPCVWKPNKRKGKRKIVCVVCVAWAKPINFECKSFSTSVIHLMNARVILFCFWWKIIHDLLHIVGDSPSKMRTTNHPVLFPISSVVSLSLPKETDIHGYLHYLVNEMYISCVFPSSWWMQVKGGDA